MLRQSTKATAVVLSLSFCRRFAVRSTACPEGCSVLSLPTCRAYGRAELFEACCQQNKHLTLCMLQRG